MEGGSEIVNSTVDVLDDGFVVNRDGEGGRWAAVGVGIRISFEQGVNPSESSKQGSGFRSFGVVVGVGGRWWKEATALDIGVNGVIGRGNYPRMISCHITFDGAVGSHYCHSVPYCLGYDRLGCGRGDATVHEVHFDELFGWLVGRWLDGGVSEGGDGTGLFGDGDGDATQWKRGGSMWTEEAILGVVAAAAFIDADLGVIKDVDQSGGGIDHRVPHLGNVAVVPRTEWGVDVHITLSAVASAEQAFPCVPHRR